MSLTVARLHKQLGELIAAGHGRKPVVVNKSTFTHPLEDEGVCMLSASGVEGPQWIANSDDDGGTKWNRDGSESGQSVVVIFGADHD